MEDDALMVTTPTKIHLRRVLLSPHAATSCECSFPSCADFALPQQFVTINQSKGSMECLKSLLGDLKANFISHAQKVVIDKILHINSDIVAILPTGG